MTDEKCESRIYIGNIDHKVSESNVIKMFSPFGKIVSEDFLWHTQGPKRGEPRGYAFIQYNSKEVSGKVLCDSIYDLLATVSYFFCMK